MATATNFQYQVGDRVRFVGVRSAGAIATVAGVAHYGENIRPHFDGEPAPDGSLWAANMFEPHVDTFPILADKDPWRESEHAAPGWTDLGETRRATMEIDLCRAAKPDGLPGLSGSFCSRAQKHSDGHVSRCRRGIVIARWPQELAAKPGPSVGEAIVAVANAARGVIIDRPTGRTGPGFWVRWQYHSAPYSYPLSMYGSDIIPAADWDAQQKRDTIPAPPVEPPPAGRFDFLTGDLGGPAPCYKLTELFTAKLAIALFEEDNAVTIARVADDGHGGIGTAAARERLVWMSAEPQREAYMREAAGLLQRAGEL